MCRRFHARVLLLVVAATMLAGPSVSFAARQMDLDSWLARDVTPFVVEQLTTHPRFKGERVRFVVFEDGSPAPESNALAVALRDQLVDAVIDVEGVKIGWPYPSGAAIDCSQDAVHYYIGLEVSESANGQYRVDLRALDLEDRNWATGFARSWQGTPSRSERRAFHSVAADESFRGQRSVPFSDSQPDLLAAHLAHDLGCKLLRQVSGEYRVFLEPGDEETVPLDGVVELVSNNLSGFQTVQIAADAGRANAVLRGKAHQINNDLYQYWITITPTDASSELPTLSVSQYVNLPAAMFATSLVAQSDADVLSSIRIVELRNSHALQVRTKEDAVVFFLNHQANHGLVRLSDRQCSHRTEARIARANESLEYALPLRTLARGASSPELNWSLNPDADVFYAIAVSNSKAARALSNHLDQLPRRCSNSIYPGLEGIHLENWLMEFSATVDQWQPHIDWQAIRVRNIF